MGRYPSISLSERAWFGLFTDDFLHSMSTKYSKKTVSDLILINRVVFAVSIRLNELVTQNNTNWDVKLPQIFPFCSRLGDP